MRQRRRAYFALFRIRVAEGLQYRMAALSGASISVFWGIINAVLFTVFFTYGARGAGEGLTLAQTISYVWIGQVLHTIQSMGVDSDIHSKIISGDVGIELCRPLDLYDHWFMKTAASRLSGALHRGVLILVFACVLPRGMGLGLPASATGFMLFLASVACAFLLCNAYAMLVNTVRMGVTWGDGPTNMLFLVSGVLSGGYLPLQLWPQAWQRVLFAQPFAGYLDLPARLYVGTLAPQDALAALALQLMWAVLFTAGGKLLMRRRLSRLIVQGG